MKGELVLYIKWYCAHMYFLDQNVTFSGFAFAFWVYNAISGKLLYFELYYYYFFVEDSRRPVCNIFWMPYIIQFINNNNDNNNNKCFNYNLNYKYLSWHSLMNMLSRS